MLKILTLAALLAIGTCLPAAGADQIDLLRASLAAAADPVTRAGIHKQIGDLCVARDDYRQAAGSFIQALDLGRKSFTEAERLDMAKYISWGGDKRGALRELKLLLEEFPDNSNARILYARVLSWSGRFPESMAETDKVLKADPGNRDALLIRANVLRWQGQNRIAISIYRKLLAEEEDFDVRLGYAYAQLAEGDKKGARSSVALLKPRYPYQEGEVKEIVTELDAAARPHIEPWYSYYNDTDNNRLNRFGVHYGQWLGNWDTGFNFRYTDARDDTRHDSSQDFKAGAYSRISEIFGIGGAVGFSHLGNSVTNNFVTGNVRGDAAILNGKAGFSFARDVLDETAQLIENRIRVNSANAYVTQKFAGRFSLFGGYSYRDYSDHNNANDFQIAPAFAIYAGNPEISVGYRFRYMNYARQSNDGYFDPNDFMSHQVFAILSLDKNRFSAYLEPYIGVQSFRRYGNDSTDFIGGVSGTLGYRLSRHLRLEINGEYGNSAVETAAGFEYFLVGARFGIAF